MIYTGKCHCGSVVFEVEAPERIECAECNCSICRKSGYLHLIVPKSRFKLLQGEEELSTYTFNSGVATHLFCETCGIKSFYVPRSNPDGYSVNVRCLEPQPREVVIDPFDGQNWEQHAHKLTHLSREAERADERARIRAAVDGLLRLRRGCHLGDVDWKAWRDQRP